jgi:Flp pilus assembly protein protease CpaA
MAFTFFAHSVLVLTAAVLFYAAWTDLREFKIRNELVLALVGLFVLHALLSGRWAAEPWPILVLDFAIPIVIFLISLVFYARGGIAGGDIKLLAAAYLWAGYQCAPVFTALLLGFALVQAALLWLGFMPTKDGRRIPFGPTIAGALIVTFLSGCLEPVAHRRVPYIPLGKERQQMPDKSQPAVPQSR